MKKSFLLLLAFFTITTSFAQSSHFGIRGGINESTIITEPNGTNFPMRLGYHIGVFNDIVLGRLSIQPGLFFETKGYNSETFIRQDANNSFKASGRVTYNYLQVPINLLYNIPLPLGKIFIGGGPYVGYGLSGKGYGTSTTTANNVSTTSSIVSTPSFGSKPGDLKNPDLGISTLGGIALKNGLLLSAGYEIGLKDISYYTFKNRVLSFSIGYNF